MAIAAGACFAYTALSRPFFILLPLFLLGASWLLTWSHVTIAAQARAWIALMAAFVVGVAPWFVYNYDHFGRVTISPAGGLGRGIWEGSWQGRWSGRVQAGLTKIADSPLTTAELENCGQTVRRRAARERRLDAHLLHVVAWHPPHLDRADRSARAIRSARRRRSHVFAHRTR
jgi:hypothetical protein